MRLDIQSENRLGITQELLAVLAHRGIDVRAVDMFTHHTYVDVPGLRREQVPALIPALQTVPGVRDVFETDMLPSERQREQLRAVLSALVEPVFAIDRRGHILLANAKAADLVGKKSEEELTDARLGDYLEERVVNEIISAGFDLPDREVTVEGETFMMQTIPIGLSRESGLKIAGGVVVMQPHVRLGHMITALQKHGDTGFDAIVGDSPLMQRVKEKAMRLAAVDAPLLIRGETGTGKELFARACHKASSRSDKPFLALNCAALPESLAESELFGFTEGAFTSAARGGKPGLFELADTGTLFLDEIGELTPHLQAKLLRFLQDGTFRRIGGSKEIRVDIRLIAATNRDIEAMVKNGSFREDLFFRLNVLNLFTPALRDHPEDIPELAQTFVERAAARIGRHSPVLTPDAVSMLQQNRWPGNVREFENILFRSISLLDGERIKAADLRFDDGERSENVANNAGVTLGSDYKTAFEKFEYDLFSRLYPSYPSSRKLAARLGLSHMTVARKLSKYQID